MINKTSWYTVILLNKFLFQENLISKYGKIHIGCGDIKLDGFINIDFRATKATDLVQDCTDLSIFPDRSIRFVYAHAFLEHLKKDKRLEFLKNVNRILTGGGQVMILAIPDFEAIAKLYLQKKLKIEGGKSDLYNAYRYTHGDPEQHPKWWMEQLHKSLFDKDLLTALLQKSGFSKFMIFRYCFKEEKYPLNLGFIAGKDKKGNLDQNELKEQLMNFNSGIDLKTLRIIEN